MRFLFKITFKSIWTHRTSFLVLASSPEEARVVYRRSFNKGKILSVEIISPAPIEHFESRIDEAAALLVEQHRLLGLFLDFDETKAVLNSNDWLEAILSMARAQPIDVVPAMNLVCARKAWAS